MHRARALLGILVVAAIVCAGAVELGVPLGGISRADAIKAATSTVGPMTRSSTALEVSWAFAGPLAVFSDRPFASVAQWQQPVWAVRFHGTFDLPSCGPPPPPGEIPRCPPPDHTATVILDYRHPDVPIVIKIEA